MAKDMISRSSQGSLYSAVYTFVYVFSSSYCYGILCSCRDKQKNITSLNKDYWFVLDSIFKMAVEKDGQVQTNAI